MTTTVGTSSDASASQRSAETQRLGRRPSAWFGVVVFEVVFRFAAAGAEQAKRKSGRAGENSTNETRGKRHV